MSTNEVSASVQSNSGSERQWSLEPASTQQVAQKQQEERMKVVLQEKQDDLLNIAQNDDGASVTNLVKFCWGFAFLLLVCLIFYVSNKFLNVHSDEFDNVLLSEDPSARLKALKQHDNDNLLTLFTVVFGAVVLAFVLLFGNYMHFRDSKTHESRKRTTIIRKVVTVFMESEDYISKLNRNLGSQLMNVDHLKSSESKLEQEINEL